jgi:hypothetical protein
MSPLDDHTMPNSANCQPVSEICCGKYLGTIDLSGDRPHFRDRIAVFDPPRVHTLMVIPI